MSKRIGIVAARSKPEAADLGKRITDWLRDNGHEPIRETEIGATADNVDAVIVLGGDGLIMRDANDYPNLPLLGINFGTVGFLALVEQQDWQAAVAALAIGDFSIVVSATVRKSAW